MKSFGGLPDEKEQFKKYEPPFWMQKIKSMSFDDMDINSNDFSQFRKYLRRHCQRYNEEYKDKLKTLKSRPELIPYYIMEFEK